MEYLSERNFALQLDKEDPLRSFRDFFFFPEKNGKPSNYLCGNSLGLQSTLTKEYIEEELNVWKHMGVEGHFHAQLPWTTYHKNLKAPLARLVGAIPKEVSPMNNLTANLHLMLITFYRPDKKRFKIIMEANAFPSDQYAIESHVKFHGFDPKEAIVEVEPREGEFTLRKEDIFQTIEVHGQAVALLMFSGVQYYTGQFFDIKAITEASHKVGAYAGFDLAHAIGNIPMNLHDWEVDFAVWCSYKYLNAGPGATAGLFVHQKWEKSFNFPRLAGWWGHSEKERFLMKKGFIPMEGADGWQLGNGNIISMASLRASLSIFDKATIQALRTKSILLTGYLDFLISEV
ncbi:MAG: kynureninase, partial [Bacteroidota bacterium]|nr:kynureninase [Bacteroidota bacterium]